MKPPSPSCAEHHLVTFDGSPISAGGALLDRAEVLNLAKLADKLRIRFFCDVEAAPGLLLNFQEYDRTDAEKSAAPTPARERVRTSVSPPPTNRAITSSLQSLAG